jgi:hypothetical protein
MGVAPAEIATGNGSCSRWWVNPTPQTASKWEDKVMSELMRAKLVRTTLKGYPRLEPWESDEVEIDKHFELGKVYDVFAIWQFQNNSGLLVMGETYGLDGRNSYYFELESMNIPRDWRIHIFEEQDTTILGPAFIAEDYEFFRGILERDPTVVRKVFDYYHADS